MLNLLQIVASNKPDVHYRLLSGQDYPAHLAGVHYSNYRKQVRAAAVQRCCRFRIGTLITGTADAQITASATGLGWPFLDPSRGARSEGEEVGLPPF